MKAFVLLCAVGVGLASPALADELILDYSNVYSGYDDGNAPYARATFTTVAPGTVSLELEGFMASTAFISGFYFNFDTSLNLNSLNVSHTAGTASDGIDIRANNYNAGGGGKYDIRISFPTSNRPGSPRFNGLDTAAFLFTSTQAITAQSFAFLSAPHGGQGPFLTAAHVQGIGPKGNKSAWVAGDEVQQAVVVPLPTAAWAGLASLAGVAGLGVVRRRAMKN